MKISAMLGIIYAVLILLAIVHCVYIAPRGWGNAHITFYGSPNGQGTQSGACGYRNTFALGYGGRTAALSTPSFREEPLAARVSSSGA